MILTFWQHVVFPCLFNLVLKFVSAEYFWSVHFSIWIGFHLWSCWTLGGFLWNILTVCLQALLLSMLLTSQERVSVGIVSSGGNLWHKWIINWPAISSEGFCRDWVTLVVLRLFEFTQNYLCFSFSAIRVNFRFNRRNVSRPMGVFWRLSRIH